MKKIYIMLIFISIFLFISINNNTFALGQEQDLDNHSSLIFEDIYNGYIEYSEINDTLYLNYIDNLKKNTISLENYQFYRNKSDDRLLSLVFDWDLSTEIENMLIIDSYIRQDEGAIFFQITILTEEQNKLIRLWFNQNIAILYSLKVLEYDTEDFEIINSINMMKKLYRELKNYNSQTMGISSSENNILYAKRSLTACNNSGIQNYQANSNNSYNPDNSVKDDPIVDYIPRQYFLSTCEIVEYGNEYGYYIKTIEEATNCYFSYVSVFKVQYTFPRNIYEQGVGVRDLKCVFIPMFNYNFSSYKKDSNTSKYFNFGSLTSFVLVDTYFLDMGYTDFILTNKIMNVNGLNQCDEGYTKDGDCGLHINSVSYDFINQYNNTLESNYVKDNVFIAMSCMFITWVEPIVSTFSAIQEIIDFAYETNTKSANYDEGFKLESWSLTSAKDYCKDISIGLNTNKDFNEKYYIGRNNAEIKDLELKVAFQGNIEYLNLDSTAIETQSFNNILITTLCSFDFSGISKMATIALADEGYLTLNLISLDEYSSFSGVLYSNRVNLYPLYFTNSGMKDITILSQSYTSFVIIDSLGNTIYNDYTTANVAHKYSFYAEKNIRYFIKLNTNTSCSFNYSINSSNIYTAGTNNAITAYVNGRSTRVYSLTINTEGYYTFDTISSLDPYLTIYFGTNMIAYNDNSFILDEEGNEEFISDSHIYTYLAAGTYYLVLGNLSSRSGNITLTIK